MPRSLPFLVAFVVLPALLRAQERLRVSGPSPATVVLGSSARIDIVVEGRGGNPETPQVPTVAGLTMQLAGPSRQSFTSITPSGLTEQITVTWQIVITPQREGTFTIPAFNMQTGTRVQSVPAATITAVKELKGSEFGYLDVKVEPLRVYVHEPVRVRVEFGVDKTLRPMQGVAEGRVRYFDFDVQAPWLEDFDGAEPLPEPERGADTAPIVLNQRRLQYADYDSNHQRGGRLYNSFVFHKAFLPTRPGKVALDAPMLRYNVQLREGRRNIFDEVVGGQSQNYYVYGQPIELEVLPIPEQGRPTPYFGAVGRFTLDAVLDKDSVKVGSSVKLVLRIAGQGNFEFLRVPDLSVLEQQGLHLLGQTEQRKDDGVTVTYDLTPLAATVKQVPEIAWNYFDTTPGVERFETVATRALPLHVLPPDNPETLASLPEAAKKSVTPGVDDIFDLPALDGPARRTPRGPWWASWAAVVLPWLCVLMLRAGQALRRAALADPLRNRARAAARNCERALAAGNDPVDALAGYLADRLGVAAAAIIAPELSSRLGAAGFDSELAGEAAAAIERGVAARYGGDGGLDAATVRALVQRLEGAATAPLRKAPLWLLAALLVGSGVASAQEGDAVAAYRRGDYAAAGELFAKASERIDDRRLWFARGNCYFRQNDLPRARWAYECARLGLPRDSELAANLQLVQKQLQIDDGAEGFTGAVTALRDRCTEVELAWICGVSSLLAAWCLLFCWRRPALRWLGVVAAVPAALLAVELLWLRPSRPPLAIALAKLELAAEPRDGLPAVATVQPGVAVELRSGASGEWVRVEVGGRSGYARRRDIAIVE